MTARYPWRYSLFLGFYYAMLAVYQGFNGPFYREMGMQGTRLMLLLTAVPAVSMVMQPIWGTVGDRMARRTDTLYLLTALALAGLVLLGVSRGFAPLLLSTCLFAAAYPAVQPLGDSVILEDLAQKKLPFGPIRIVASVSYAVFSLLLGFVFEGRYALVPYVSALLALGLMLSVRVLPPMRGHQHGGARVPFSRLFAIPHVKPLLLMITALMLALGYFYSYFSLYVTGLEGGTAGLVGVSYFVSALTELPFIARSDRLFRRYGAGRLMMLSAFLLTVRFAILALTKNAYVAVATQLLHFGCFIVITLSASYFLSRAVPRELKASGQMLLQMAGFGLARVFGTVFGGAIADAAGSLAAGFALMAGLCFAALVLGGWYFMRIPPLNGE